MATRKFRGDAVNVAQVDQYTIGGTVEVGDVFNCTINTKLLSHSSLSTTKATVATDLATAWNASTIPEFAEATALGVGDILQLTGDAEGVPFTVTVATTEAGGGGADAQTFSGSTTTSAAGKWHWSDVDNWTTNAIPANTDDIYFENYTGDVLYGLDQNAVTLTSLHFAASFTGRVGLNNYNANSYYEYRDTYLKISATTVNVGQGEGVGSRRLKLNVGSAQTTVNVYRTDTPEADGLEAFLWIGTHASNVVNVQRGSVGIAVEAGQVATVATLRVGHQGNVEGDARVRCGSGVTLTTLNQEGGVVELNAGLTTVTKVAGTLTVRSGNVTTLADHGGTTYYTGTGTIATLTIGAGATVDFSRDMRGRTVTNCTIYPGGRLIDTFKTVTFTNAIQVKGSLADVTLDLGTDFGLQRS